MNTFRAVVFLCLAIVPPLLLAQAPAGQPVPLRLSTQLRRPEVRKDLEIIDEQFQQIEDLRHDRNNMMGVADMDNMTAAQKRDFLAKMRARFDEDEARIESIFLPHQKRRWSQLQTQRRIKAHEPTAGLTHPQMTESLRLSEEQIEKIKSTADNVQEKLKVKVEKLQQEIKQLQSEARREVLSSLTDEQRARYMELVGELTEYELR